MSEANVEIGRHYEIRHGKRGKRREVGIDDRSCEHPQPVDRARAEMPIGPPSCTIDRSSRGTAEVERRTRSSASRRRADPRKRPPQRHPTSTGRANLGTTSIFLQGIENAEIIDTVHADARP